MQREHAIALAIYTNIYSKNASMQRVKTPVKTPLLQNWRQQELNYLKASLY